MKISFICTIIIFSVGLLIPLQVNAQCGEPVPSEPNATPSAGDVVLTFWHTMDDAEAANLQSIIDSFHDETNISIVVKRIDPKVL